ncbi:MAG TPA: hypothetical protein VK812_19550 [Candidatus Binatus sp.]|jgi:hypothetical protein|nr:hypothetical protein [Candidatus Binatus sp.]
MANRALFTAHSFLMRLAVSAAVVLIFALLARAGGPKNVAGTSYFDPTVTGQPLVWPQGMITYYTDQGDLSRILPNASANALIANAFSQWTAVPTAAITATSGGMLAEDVSGANVFLNSDGTISMPADIQPSATRTPVGVVYDFDGSVTDALLGSGAGSTSQCFSNAVYGGNDNYGTFATYQHALIVINGQCALQSSQLTDVEYRLVRVIGSVLGLGWSQVNPNVLTRSPLPTAADYLGFPVMHATDPLNCVPITICYANPYQLAMDDTASLSRLYPVTAENQSSFPGKQVFSTVTARIHGSVWFTDPHGNPTQAMQGVNVVARWIDPTTNLPSRQYAAAAVSGFLFTGNAGNPITGFDDALGNPLAEWGTNGQTLEGFFDLAGLQPPNGSSGQDQYQLSVEALDPKWSADVGPYSPGPVLPSGLAQPVTLTVTPGNDVELDIVMANAAQPLPPIPSTWTTPAVLPLSGDWQGSLSDYGNISYFLLPAQANRTLSVAVTALDEYGNPSLGKVQPVIGMWAATDPPGTAPPALTPSPFNQVPYGLTRLDAQVETSTNFLIGISDFRGDGRPDYRYHAYVLYGDSVSPSRIGVSGGTVTVLGTGFYPGLSAALGSTSVTPLSVSAGRMILSASPHADGTQNITLSDPISAGSSVMTNALTYGAAASDIIVLLSGSLNPSTPVGTQASHPMSVRVLQADGLTPVSGATIGWSASNGLQLSVCGGASSCSVTSDQNGDAANWLTPAAVGVATITATLAPGAYSVSPSVSATLNATESASDIGVLTPYLWIAQGATVSVPLTARVLSNGAPQNNVHVNFAVESGSGTLSASSATTSSSGFATVTLTVTQIAALVQVSACVAPGNLPCQTFYATPVPLAQQTLQPVAGAGQVSAGQSFQPVVVRVTDFSAPPNPVIAASVTFLTTILRPGGTSPAGGSGETNPTNPSMPVILQVNQSNATTDLTGLASIVPSGLSFSPPVEVDVTATAGISAFLDFPLEVLPAFVPENHGGPSLPPPGRPVMRIVGPGTIRKCAAR